MHIKSEKQKGAINIYMAEITDIDKKRNVVEFGKWLDQKTELLAFMWVKH